MQGLEILIAEEGTNRSKLKEELDNTTELLNEAIVEVEENKKTLNSLLKLRYDLSDKLRRLAVATSQGEAELQKLAAEREPMVGGMDVLRRQNEIFRRRIQFCREAEPENNGMVDRCSLREFSAEEIRLATENFSERLRIKSGADFSGVYKCRVNLQTVAIKMLTSSSNHALLTHQDFQLKVLIINTT